MKLVFWVVIIVFVAAMAGAVIYVKRPIVVTEDLQSVQMHSYAGKADVGLPDAGDLGDDFQYDGHTGDDVQYVQASPVKEDEMPESESYVEHQVLAVAESKREAKKIAGQIGGELVSYDNQIAVIQIGITVEEMMQKLEDDPGLPKVYPNYQGYMAQ